MENKEIKPICVFQGPISSRSGYGDHARDIAMSLIKSEKYDVKIVSTQWGSTPPTALNDKSPNSITLASHILQKQLTAVPEIFIQMSIPVEFNPMGKYNIGITAGIETTVCKGDWIEGLNKMDMNIVPSKHARDVFDNSKFKKKLKTGQEVPLELTKPIEVLFEGSDLEIYHKTDKIAQSVTDSLSDIPEDFLFLFVGHWLNGKVGADRKDISMMIKTFCEVFKNQKKKPALLLKVSSATFSHIDKDHCLKKIKMIKSYIEGDLPNIYLLHGDLSSNEINSLYNHPKVKTHISFTHGEGYGRPLQEATLSEKPLLVSDWSGHKDFLNPDLALLLPGEVKPLPKDAVNEWLIAESGWFNVNYSVAAQMIDKVYNKYDSFLPNAKKLGKENAKRFSLEKMDEAFDVILQKYLPEFEMNVEVNLPKLVKKGSNSAGGISLPKLKKKTSDGSQSVKLPALKKK